MSDTPSSGLQRLIHELKRRRIFHVTGVYAAVAFVMLQAADLLFPALLLPDWAFRLLAAFVVLGFPIALVLTWAFEITPDGVKRTAGAARGGRDAAPVSSSASSARARSSRAPGYVGLGILLGLAGFGMYAYVAGTPDEPVGTAADDVRSIAVLPFADMSAAGDQEFFSHGLAEELLNALAQIEGLKVAARTSSFAFEGKDVGVREIGRALDVASVLEGSVRKVGDRVRITAQLIDAESGYHLWSDSYDRRLEDVFHVQDEIARAIVGALQLHLPGGDATRLVREHTSDPEAHMLYLKGNHLARQRTRAALEQVVEYFRGALELDSTFALAYAGLADAYTVLASYGHIPVGEAHARGRSAVERALELAPDLAEAHVSMAAVLQDEREWAAAEAEFRKAVELRPSYARAHHWYAIHLFTRGRVEEAFEQIHRAEVIDPLSPHYPTVRARMHFFAGDIQQAIRTARSALALDPGSPVARSVLGYLYSFVGRHDEAIATLEPVVAQAPDVFRRSALGLAYARAGEPNRARAVLERLGSENSAESMVGLAMARIHAALEDPDAMFRWFDRTEWTMQGYYYLISDPVFDPYRSDPRFARLLDRLTLN